MVCRQVAAAVVSDFMALANAASIVRRVTQGRTAPDSHVTLPDLGICEATQGDGGVRVEVGRHLVLFLVRGAVSARGTGCGGEVNNVIGGHWLQLSLLVTNLHGLREHDPRVY